MQKVISIAIFSVAQIVKLLQSISFSYRALSLYPAGLLEYRPPSPRPAHASLRTSPSPMIGRDFSPELWNIVSQLSAA